ncbi:hypothetical protein LJR143_003924 [Pseudoxanthomonas sp. LjRoot143]|uniref:hypothetical protein n=1 Tax=Pseudoxanthomonas sp. LjRoot143 TaxID=3342266 RepID=UPI003ECF996A
MRSIFLASLLATGPAVGDGYEPAVWLSNSNVLACSPNTLRAPHPLILTLGPGHGSELAIRRVSDNTWYFLVGHMPPDGEPQLTTPEKLALANSIEVPTSFRGRASEADALAPIFNRSGAYEAYLSDNLESEEGGYVCSFNYIGMSPNNSFKPNPLRCAA